MNPPKNGAKTHIEIVSLALATVLWTCEKGVFFCAGKKIQQHIWVVLHTYSSLLFPSLTPSYFLLSLSCAQQAEYELAHGYHDLQ